MSGSAASTMADASGRSGSKAPATPLEDLPGLTAFLEAVAKELAQELSAYCRYPTDWSIAKPQSRRLFEVLTGNRGLSLGVLEGSNGDTRAFVIFEQDFASRLIDAIFGAKSTQAQSDEQESAKAKGPSKTAQRFLKAAVGDSAKALSSALEPLKSLSFSGERLEPIGDVFPRDLQDLSVISTQVEILAPPEKMNVTFLLPQPFLESLRREFSETTTHQSSAPVDPLWTRQLGSAMAMTPLQVFAVMEDLELSLGELANLRVGQVLNLAGSGMGKLRLVVGGRDMFSCRLKPGADEYALIIEGTNMPAANTADPLDFLH